MGNESAVRWKCKTRHCQNKPPSNENVDEDAADAWLKKKTLRKNIETLGPRVFDLRIEKASQVKLRKVDFFDQLIRWAQLKCVHLLCIKEKSNQCSCCAASKNRKAGHQTFSSPADRPLAQSRQIRRRKGKFCITRQPQDAWKFSNMRLVCF